MLSRLTFYFSPKGALLSLLMLLNSCKDSEQITKQPSGDQVHSTSIFSLDDDLKNNEVFYTDTFNAHSTNELIKHIGNNRVIKLEGKDYQLQSTIQIDGITNLKLTGTEKSKLLIPKKNTTVVEVRNSNNIELENLLIVHTSTETHKGEQGIIRVLHSYNVNISKVELRGARTFGLVTYDVFNLSFSNSEITECTSLLFELEKSQKIEFSNSKFHNNNIDVSVLGGFSNLTKNVLFEKCLFQNNLPKLPGNPAFNFADNYLNPDEKITFSKCTFKNNKGYKWYGDKIVLDNCTIDTSNFSNFPTDKD